MLAREGRYLAGDGRLRSGVLPAQHLTGDRKLQDN
jgi:hypothetical protein